LKTDALFRPIEINGMPLRNRIVMAPMTRVFATNEGVPTAAMAEYYRRRAAGEVGLIVTEGVFVDHPSAGYDRNIPSLSTPDQLHGWRQVTDAVHSADGKIAAQLWHVGRQRTTKKAPFPDAPTLSSGNLRSRLPSSSGTPMARPRAMTLEEIADTQAAFARSAAMAREAGFDAVEVHGAHGYLVDQFLWEGANNRTDEYGGSLTNRLRFAVELVEAIRKAVGPDYPVLFRFSQWKADDYQARIAQTPEELGLILNALKRSGVDCLHASQRDHAEESFPPSPLNLAGWSEKLTGLPAISVGKVALSGEFTSSFRGEECDLRPLDEVLGQMERGDYSLIAIGRALIADPELPRKVREGRFGEVVPFRREMLKTLE
jgi:2,4-dienoyl-CoA reductase-like NADH-dependent reductase (Old Yellow Enzyme family)